MEPLFLNRIEAGRRLALALEHLKDSDPLVIGVPRGGIFVAVEVARALGGRPDLVIVRRVTAPGRPDATVGAIADGAEMEVFCDEAALAAHGMTRKDFDAEVSRLSYAIALQQSRYASGRPRVSVQNRAVILAEDMIVTGSTARVAARALYKESARHVAIAAPVAVLAGAAALQDECDELDVLAEVADLEGARGAYADFRPVTDHDVVCLMHDVPIPYLV